MKLIAEPRYWINAVLLYNDAVLQGDGSGACMLCDMRQCVLVVLRVMVRDFPRDKTRLAVCP